MISRDWPALVNNELNFCGGKIGTCLEIWFSLVSGAWMRRVLSGHILEFSSLPPLRSLRPLILSSSDQLALDAALVEYIRCGIVEWVSDHEGSYFSNVFPVLKKDGLSARVILNLKDLNPYVVYSHFKMDSLVSILPLITPGCWFASLDLLNAYFSVPVCPSDRRWFRFRWRDEVYQYTCLPQGLSSAPRTFTKLLKPVMGHLRSVGITAIIYIDDCLIIASSEEELVDHVMYASRLFDSLGLTINVEKSQFSPTQVINYLGFSLDSLSMSVALTEDKMDRIKSLGFSLLKSSRVSIRELASFIGSVVAAEPGVPLAAVHYKYLEIVRNNFLVLHKGNYDGIISLDGHARELIEWWTQHVHSQRRSLLTTPPQYILTTDASLSGWGAVLDGLETRGHWAHAEIVHINVLELKAVLFGLQSLCSHIFNSHIRVISDNTTVVACLARAGSIRPLLLDVTESIFHWAFVNGNSISAEFLCGVENTVADRLSRDTNLDSEWRLFSSCFDELCGLFGVPCMDLFASRLNFQLRKFVSWKPDPLACHVDAFTLSWGDGRLYYVFPPFSLLGRVLRKVEQDQALVLLVAPVWESQVWFPKLLHLLAEAPVLLPKWCLSLPQDENRVHPLGSQLALAGMLVSGDPLRRQAFRQGLSQFCVPRGGLARRINTGGTLNGGRTFVSQGMLIHFSQL